MNLRAGNVHPTTGALSFLKQMLDKLPSSTAATRTRLRLDGAFYDREIVEALDRERIGYVVSAKMTRPLGNTMVAARYHPFAYGWGKLRSSPICLFVGNRSIGLWPCADLQL